MQFNAAEKPDDQEGVELHESSNKLALSQKNDRSSSFKKMTIKVADVESNNEKSQENANPNLNADMFVHSENGEETKSTGVILIDDDSSVGNSQSAAGFAGKL